MSSRVEKRKRPGEPPTGGRIEVCNLFLAREHALPIPRNDGEKNAPYLARLESMVRHILGADPKDKLNYDHNPALRLRKYRPRQGKPIASWYSPHANDPEFLFPMAYTDHVRKTQHKGHGAQHSDRVLIVKLRRIERKERGVFRKKTKIQSRGFDKRQRKFKWGKR